MYRQVTVLRDYYATSDPDDFCFDKHKDDREHYEEWIQEYFKSGKGLDKQSECRVYPSDLLPQEHHNQQGHWRIIVEFIPTGKED